MSSNYWQGRFSRRSVLRASGLGGVGLAGAALLGCGSDEDAPSTGAPGGTGGGGGSTAAPTTAPGGAADAPQRGGVYRLAEPVGPDHHDMLSTTSIATYRTGRWAYSKLLQWTPGDGEFASGQMEGDLVESMEQSDELTYIMNLRQNVTWDDRAPTSGRPFVAEDVELAWDRWTEVGQRRNTISNKASEFGPIASVTALDDHTVEVKLAFPDAVALQAMNWQNNFWVLPREALDGGFDPRVEMRGTGPFVLTDDRKDVSMTFERNPKWHGNEGGTWVDGVEVTIIPEPAQWEAQFRAGNIHEGIGSASNVPIVASEMANSKIAKFAPNGYGGTVSLSWLPDSPFHDVRVRRAISMSIDRDTTIDVYSNPSDFAALGVELNGYWYNPLSPAYGAFWLDPQGPNFGPAAQYLHHNIAEATALLSAAGYSSSNQFEFDVIEHPRSTANRAELLQAMWAQAGMKVNVTPADYVSEWQEYLSGGRGYVEWKTGRPFVLLKPNSTDSDALFWLTRFFSQAGSGIGGDEFPELHDMIISARRIADYDERVAAVHDIQRYIVDESVGPAYDAMTERVEIYNTGVNGAGRWQPWMGLENYGAASSTIAKHYWLDESLHS